MPFTLDSAVTKGFPTAAFIFRIDHYPATQRIMLFIKAKICELSPPSQKSYKLSYDGTFQAMSPW